jgi:hypothetical protein
MFSDHDPSPPMRNTIANLAIPDLLAPMERTFSARPPRGGRQSMHGGEIENPRDCGLVRDANGGAAKVLTASLTFPPRPIIGTAPRRRKRTRASVRNSRRFT